MLHVALFAALTAVGGFLKIPFLYSAITLQFFFTALSGIVLGPKYGALSQGVYVALGLLGLPIFVSGGGISYLFAPTCGFLLGLIPAAWVTGKIAFGSTSSRRIVSACLAGLLVLYAVGLPYMAGILNIYMGKDLNTWGILMAGMIPFLPGDGLKILAAGILAPRLVPRMKIFQPVEFHCSKEGCKTKQPMP
jgi:biotin transport system substrate-specific component